VHPAALARPEEARLLGRACLVAAAVLAVTAAVPMSPTSPRALSGTLAVVALGIGLALRAWADRVRVWHVHTVLGLATAFITIGLAASTTPHGRLTTAVSYVWVAMFTAAFHERTTTLHHLAGIAAGLAIGLACSGGPAAARVWAYLVVTLLAVALVLNGRVLALRDAMATDPLTGALSRRAFRQAAEVEMARARRTGATLTLIVLDLDGFKKINDAHGHAAGDAVLAGSVRAWRTALRAGDLLGRFGGDEFTFLLPETRAAGARALLARLDSQLCRWSAGVAQWDGEQSFEEWFSAADADLYTAKGH
jgi:diguanylate cyclase (GGDEF)-like protein